MVISFPTFQGVALLWTLQFDYPTAHTCTGTHRVICISVFSQKRIKCISYPRCRSNDSVNGTYACVGKKCVSVYGKQSTNKQKENVIAGVEAGAAAEDTYSSICK